MSTDTAPMDGKNEDVGLISKIANKVSPELTPGVVRDAPNPDNIPLDAGRRFDFGLDLDQPTKDRK